MSHPIVRLLEQAIFTIDTAKTALTLDHRNTPASLPESLSMTIQLLQMQVDIINDLERLSAHREQAKEIEKIFPSNEINVLSGYLEELSKIDPDDPEFLRKLQSLVKK